MWDFLKGVAKAVTAVIHVVQKIINAVAPDSAVADAVNKVAGAGGSGGDNSQNSSSKNQRKTSNRNSSKGASAPVLTAQQKRLVKLHQKTKAFDKPSDFLVEPQQYRGRSFNWSEGFSDTRAEQMMNYRQALIGAENDNLAICVANRLYHQGLPPETVSMTDFLSRFAQYNWHEESDKKAEDVYNKALAQLAGLQATASPYIQFTPTPTPVPGMGGFMTNIPDTTPTLSGIRGFMTNIPDATPTATPSAIGTLTANQKPLNNLGVFTYVGSLNFDDPNHPYQVTASEKVTASIVKLREFLGAKTAPWFTNEDKEKGTIAGTVTVDEILAYLMSTEGANVPEIQEAIEARYLYFEGGQNFQGPPSGLPTTDGAILQYQDGEPAQQYRDTLAKWESSVPDIYMSRLVRSTSYYQPWTGLALDPNAFKPSMLKVAQGFLANPNDSIHGASTWNPANLPNNNSTSWIMRATVTADGKPYTGPKDGKPYIIDPVTNKPVETVDWQNTAWHFANIDYSGGAKGDGGLPSESFTGTKLEAAINRGAIGRGPNEVLAVTYRDDGTGRVDAIVLTPAQTVNFGYSVGADGLNFNPKGGLR